MTIENAIVTPIILIIASVCVCFMLRFHNIATLQVKNTYYKKGNQVKVIRLADAVIDAIEEWGD